MSAPRPLIAVRFQVGWIRSAWAGSVAGLPWAALWLLAAGAAALAALSSADHLTRER
jgi:hypothetical protein